MPCAKDLANALKFIGSHAETPQIAVHMVAALIDGVAGWSDLGPLDVRQDATGDSLVRDGDGCVVHLHEML